MIPDRKNWGTRMIPGRKTYPAKNTLVVAAMDFTSKQKNHLQLENQADFLLSDWSAVFHPGRRINQDDYRISILVCPTTLIYV